jgi:hypothetical protein
MENQLDPQELNAYSAILDPKAGTESLQDPRSCSSMYDLARRPPNVQHIVCRMLASADMRSTKGFCYKGKYCLVIKPYKSFTYVQKMSDMDRLGPGVL